MPYRVVADGSGNVKIASSNAGKEFAPEEISAQVLRKLADDSGKFLGDKVNRAPCCSQLTQLLPYTRDVALRVLLQTFPVAHNMLASLVK